MLLTEIGHEAGDLRIVGNCGQRRADRRGEDQRVQPHGDNHTHFLHHANSQLLVARGWQDKRPERQHTCGLPVDLQIARRLQRNENRRQSVRLIDINCSIHNRLQVLRKVLPRAQDKHGIVPVRVEVIAQEIAVHRAGGGRLQQQRRVCRDGNIRLHHAHIGKFLS